MCSSPIPPRPPRSRGSAVRQGLGLTFKPYGLLSPSKDHAAGTPADWQWDGGFDLYKNITPNLVGAFSYNTDFAETEVDERRINLSRFSLYFPEKRTFFLEGSEIFNFGTTMPGNGSGFAPFFSRRIGLFEGRQIPISFGTKMFGKIGDTNLQVLDVRTGATESLGLQAENFLVARVSQNIWAESRVGAIFTTGSPTGARNSLAGFDFVYQTSRFLKDKNFLAGGWLVYNWNDRAEGRKEGFGFKIDYPNDLWDIVTSYNSYGDALDPGVGYLPRPGVQVFSLSASYRPRPEKGLVGRLVRQFFYEASVSYTWDLDGRLETRRLFTAPLNLQTESGEHFEFNIVPNYDALPEDWEVADGVVLPRGAYAFTNYAVQFETASHRAWGGRVEWAFGPFYSGHYDNVEAGFRVKLKGYATFDLDANFVRGRLPEGTFKENVYQLKVDLYLSPRLGLMNYVQYDDVSNELGLNTRFRWEITPGNVVYLRLLEELGTALGPGVTLLPSRGTGHLQDHPQHPPLSRLRPSRLSPGFPLVVPADEKPDGQEEQEHQQDRGHDGDDRGHSGDGILGQADRGIAHAHGAGRDRRPGDRLGRVDAAGDEQAADHGQNGADVADDVPAGGEEDGPGGRPEDRLDDVVDGVDRRDLVDRHLDEEQDPEDDEHHGVGQGAPRRLEGDEIGVAREKADDDQGQIGVEARRRGQAERPEEPDHQILGILSFWPTLIRSGFVRMSLLASKILG